MSEDDLNPYAPPLDQEHPRQRHAGGGFEPGCWRDGNDLDGP